MADKHLKIVKQTQNSIESESSKVLSNNQLLDNKVELLSTQLKELDSKFDLWQGMVESILASTQTAMQYDNFILTYLAIFVAIASILVTK